MAAATPSRADEIRLIWTENQWLYLVDGFIGGIIFCLLIQLSIQNLSELIISLLPEAAGILVTITVIDVLNRRRDERNAVKQLQEQLVRDASSIVNDVANNAVHQLRNRGWLEGIDGLLAKADLRGANLHTVDLMFANLEKSNFTGANLQESLLGGVNLQEAVLGYSNLKEAYLHKANLQGAKLWGASLQEATLGLANLQGAYLGNAKLQGAYLGLAKLQGAYLGNANLENVNFGYMKDLAQFDETTIMPDGTHWTPDTDLTKFTHPKTDMPAE